MIALEATPDHPATSLSRFFESHLKQYRELANADIYEGRRPKGRPDWRSAEVIEKTTNEAIEMIARGKTLGQAARKFGVKTNTLQQRLYSRGLTVKKIREGAE